MSKIPADLKYTKTHEWIRIEANGTLTVGLTDFAQQQLSDIVFFEAFCDRTVKEGDAVGDVESVKAAIELFAPVSGDMIAVNQEVAYEWPEGINEDPYENWLYKMKLGAGASIDHLLTADAYAKLIG